MIERLRELRALDPRRVWDVLLIAAFVPGAAYWTFLVLIYPIGLGSHANIYTDAAAAWLRGADPWAVGPPTAIFAGPPTMLLPFVPFVSVPVDVTRLAWFALDLGIAAWTVRRLQLPAYWLAFPPLFSAIILGHIEVLVLAAIVLGGALSGLAAVVKPYAAVPLIAEKRWSALAVAAAVVVVTMPFVPWAQFLRELDSISLNLARQDTGDSVFGQPLLMAAAIVALLSLGPSRALWLGVPLLWPHAQGIYKTMTIPALTPIVAFFWALPISGATLVGVVTFALVLHLERVRKLPGFLREGIQPASQWNDDRERRPGIAIARPVAA